MQVGKLQGQALLDEAEPASSRGKKPTIVMINGSPTDANAAQFKTGAHSVLDGKVNIAAEYDTPDWSPDQAQTEMDQAITKLGKTGFDGVYAANDGTAGGAIAAMKAAGIDPKTKPITGQDAELAAIQRILLGEQYMTVYKAIKLEAAAAAELAVALAQGKPAPSTLTIANVNNDVDGRPLRPADPGRGDQEHHQGHGRQGRLLDASSRSRTRRSCRRPPRPPDCSRRSPRTDVSATSPAARCSR